MIRRAKGISGFTLTELLVSLSIFIMMVGALVTNFRRSPTSTQAAAMGFSSALVQARQEAISGGVPVAVAIPSGSGGSASYYLLSGEQPRVTRVWRMDSEQPEVRLLVGTWGTADISPPPENALSSDFRPELWALPRPEDYIIIFTPDGRATSNDLPHFDGAYHVLVSHGGTTGSSSPGGTGIMPTAPTYMSIDTVGSPYTVTVTFDGTIRSTPGVVGATSIPATLEQAPPGTPPAPPALAPPPGTPPVLVDAGALPDPVKLNLPAGVNMLLSPDRHLTLTVRATSPERVPLYCEWTASGGGLSSNSRVRMRYIPEDGEWESVWHWHPPSGVGAGAPFTLSGELSDDHGHTTPVTIDGVTDFVVQTGDNSRRLAFSSSRDGDVKIYTVNLDGTGLLNVSGAIPNNHYRAAWSPDGRRLAFDFFNSGDAEVFMINDDRTGFTPITNLPGNDQTAFWSPTGGRIAFNSGRVAPYLQVHIANADGSGEYDLAGPAGPHYHPTWSPDGLRIVMESSRDGNQEIYTCNADGTGLTNVSADPGQDTGPSWSPDSSQVCFYSNRDGTGDIYIVNADGTGLTNLTGDPVYDHEPQWSPAGGQICFSSYRDGNSEVYVINTDGTGLTNLSNNGAIDQKPFWTPDGAGVVFASWRDGNQEIYYVNADGTGLLNLTQDPGLDQQHTAR